MSTTQQQKQQQPTVNPQRDAKDPSAISSDGHGVDKQLPNVTTQGSILPQQPSPNISLERALTPAQVGVNVLRPHSRTQKEQRNLEFIQSFLLEYGIAAKIEKCLERVHSQATFNHHSWPEIKTAVEWIELTRKTLYACCPTMTTVPDIVIVKGNFVAVHTVHTIANIGTAPAGLSAPTFHSGKFTTMHIFILDDSTGKIIDWRMNYDRDAIREQLEWPSISQAQSTDANGNPVLQLGVDRAATIIATPSLPKAREPMNEFEQKNYDVCRQFFHTFFHGVQALSPEDRLNKITELLDKENTCFAQGFPDTTILQHAINCTHLISCTPDIKIQCDDGFAKENLVSYTFSCNGSMTQGRPLGFLPSRNKYSFVCHCIFVMNKESKIQHLVGVWPRINGFLQFGVKSPFSSPIYVPLASKIGIGLIDCEYRERERANMNLLDKYIRDYYTTTADNHSSDSMVDPAGPFVAAGFPHVNTIGEWRQFAYSHLFPASKTRKIISIDALFASGDVVVAHFCFEAFDDGNGTPKPSTTQPSTQVLKDPTGKRAVITSTLVAIADGSRIRACIEESDVKNAFEQIGWLFPPNIGQPKQLNDSFWNRWSTMIQKLQTAASVVSTSGSSNTVEERQAIKTLHEFLHTAMDWKIANPLPLVAHLIAPNDVFMLTGFPIGSHLEWASSLSIIRACAPNDRLVQPEFFMSKGNHVLALFGGVSKHDGEAYFGRPASGRGGSYTAAMISQLDDQGRLSRSWGEWCADLHFNILHVPSPTEMVASLGPSKAAIGLSLPRASNGFNWQDYSVTELRNIRRAIDFVTLAFTLAGPPNEELLGRRTHLADLLAPFISKNLILEGGGYGFNNRALQYLSFWSLELLPSIPDARISEFSSILARGSQVDLQVRFTASHCGIAFRQTKQSNKKVDLTLQFSLIFDSLGLVERLVSLGNDERLAKSLGFHLSDCNYGGCFATSFRHGASEVKTVSGIRVETIHARGSNFRISRLTCPPGWKWSTHLKPIVKTDLCVHSHYGIVLSGALAVKTKDGEQTMSAGSAFFIPPGHDAWVVGNQPCVLIDTGAPIDMELPLMTKSFDKPDETKELPKMKLQYVHFGSNASIGRIMIEPGWKWSEDVMPIVKTPSCQHRHYGIFLSGTQDVVQMDTNSIGRCGPVEEGDTWFFECEPGHDSWVVGNQPVLMFDISPMIKHYGINKNTSGASSSKSS